VSSPPVSIGRLQFCGDCLTAVITVANKQGSEHVGDSADFKSQTQMQNITNSLSLKSPILKLMLYRVFISSTPDRFMLYRVRCAESIDLNSLSLSLIDTYIRTKMHAAPLRSTLNQPT